MAREALRKLDLSLLPSMGVGMDIFIRLDQSVDEAFKRADYLAETYERVQAALMFFFQTDGERESWRNDAHLRAGLNEFYSLGGAIERDLRRAKMVAVVPQLHDSKNPLVQLMYLLRHVGVHTAPFASGVSQVDVISDVGGEAHPYSFRAVILAPLRTEDLHRSAEAKRHYDRTSLAAALDWLMEAQSVFGVPEVFRRGLNAHCEDILSVLP